MTGDGGISIALDPHHPAPTVPMISFSDHEPYFLSFSWEAVPQSSFRAESRSGFRRPLPREDRSRKREAWILGAGVPWCL